MHVLEDDNLSLNDKQKVLQSMADEAEQLVDATAEGMQSSGRNHRAEELRTALAALTAAEKGNAAPTNPVDPSKRHFQQIIAVMTENSRLNDVVVELAIDLARLSRGAVSLLSVLPPTIDDAGPAAAGMPMVAPVAVPSLDASKVLEDRKRSLEELKAEKSQGETMTIEVRSGDVEREIVDFAEKAGADVIIVGSPDRSWLEGFFDPPIDRSVVKSAPCPVLVVPEPNRT